MYEGNIGSSAKYIQASMPRFHTKPAPVAHWTPKFIVFKRLCDLGLAIAALPIIFMTSLVLLALNPFYNPGPLLFRQERMGMGGIRIKIWKFRTMTGSVDRVRAHDAPLEMHRTTTFGKFLRKTHIDEIPNFINVLKGEMSLVGPRPDAWDHALEYLSVVPHYRDRFLVRPGITGLAQVRSGYADCSKSIERKARLDRYYVRRSRMLLDIYIIYRTITLLYSELVMKK